MDGLDYVVRQWWFWFILFLMVSEIAVGFGGRKGE